MGLDVGTYGVKGVELSAQGNRFVITNFGSEPIAGGDHEARLRALRDLVSRCRFKATRIVSAVSGRSVIVRYVNIRKMTDDELKQSMRFEADKYIPFSLSEVIIDCQRLGTVEPATGEMKVLLVAVKRNLIDEHVALLKSADISASIIDIDSFALGNAFSMCFGKEEEGGQRKTRALIDIGASKTDINIMGGLDSQFTREIYVGGNDFTENISRKLMVEPAEVEQLKKAPGEKENEMREAVGPALDDLQNEIQLSFDFFENEYETEINEIYVSGGGSLLPGLEETLSQVFSRPVTRWSPVERLESRLSEQKLNELKAAGSQVAVAVGLASRIGKV